MAEGHGEAKGQKAGAHTGADGGHGGAFPPFDSSTFPSQLVSLVVPSSRSTSSYRASRCRASGR